MDRAVKGILLYVALFAIIPLTLYFILPDPAPDPNAPTAEEHQHVQSLIEQISGQVPQLEVRYVRTNDRRVAQLHANWFGEDQPDRGDPAAWNRLALRVARQLAPQIPPGWHLNVALYDGPPLPRGFAGAPGPEAAGAESGSDA